MATHSGILAWRVPWTEEPGGLQPMVLQRVGCVRKFLLENTRKTRRTIPCVEHFPCFLRRKGDFKRSVFKEWEITCFPDVP